MMHRVISRDTRVSRVTILRDISPVIRARASRDTSPDIRASRAMSLRDISRVTMHRVIRTRAIRLRDTRISRIIRARHSEHPARNRQLPLLLPHHLMTNGSTTSLVLMVPVK